MTTITQTNLLNNLTKSYDKNIKIVGFKYDIKDSRTYNKKSYDAWCVRVMKGALVLTGVVKDEDVFVTTNGEKTLMRGIVSNMHPLGPKNNSAIVVAFTEASFAQQIKETVRKGKDLRLGQIKIQVHLPPILDCLHNAALKFRSEELEKARKAGKPRKIHCNISLSSPWITLIEVAADGSKSPIPFQIEDGRLIDPANAMAILALNRGKFKPFRFLSEAEKKDIPQKVMRPADPENPIGAQVAMEHDQTI